MSDFDTPSAVVNPIIKEKQNPAKPDGRAGRWKRERSEIVKQRVGCFVNVFGGLIAGHPLKHGSGSAASFCA